MIKLEVGKALRNDAGPDLEQVEKSLSAQIARYLGSGVRERVQQRGDLAGQQFPGYSNHYFPLYVSPDYPDNTKAFAVRRGSGARVYGPVVDPESGRRRMMGGREYHALNRTLLGSYSPTGGMWSGLSAVISSFWRAEVAFRGRSAGRDPWASQNKTRRYIARTTKVNNAFKAWTVVQAHGISLLSLKDEELELVAEAVGVSVADAIGRQLDVRWTGAAPRKEDLDTLFGRLFQVPALKNASAV